MEASSTSTHLGRPEIELLLCCARTSLGGAALRRARFLVGNGIDWEYLVLKAAGHGVHPLLYRNLKTFFPDRVPPLSWEKLSGSFLLNAQNSLFLSQELVGIVDSLAERKIPAAPLKGPLLAFTAYGNLALRQFGDLDILVRRKDVMRVKELLLDLGYESSLSPVQQDRSLQRHYHLSFQGRSRKTRVEIHWALSRPYWRFSFDFDRLLANLESVRFLDRTVPYPRSEDVLLILCAHGSKHHWRRLGWICDVAELIGRYRLSWGRVLPQAEQVGSLRMLLLGLSLARDLLGSELPGVVQEGIRSDEVLQALRVEVKERLFAQTPGPLAAPIRHSFYLRVRERRRDRIPYRLHYLRRTLREVLVPNRRDRDFVRLPETLAFLHYLIKPLRLALKYGARPLRFRRVAARKS